MDIEVWITECEVRDGDSEPEWSLHIRFRLAGFEMLHTIPHGEEYSTEEWRAVVEGRQAPALGVIYTDGAGQAVYRLQSRGETTTSFEIPQELLTQKLAGVLGSRAT